MQACPVHTQAGRYVSLIAEGRFEEAYRYARQPNPLASICGRVCGHPCETACRRGQFDAPISIRALKRFVTERYGPESRNPLDLFPEKPKVTHPERVAVIGSGPAGLAAAHDLALLGYAVTIFEAAQVPGGMLHLGIPEYRLPRDVVQAQVREILALGPELRLNSRLGDFSLSDLRREGFQAILLAIGLHRSRDLILPGRDLDGVITGTDFLLNVNLGYQFSIGKRVAVIGGGNVAMDVARSALRQQQRQTLDALSSSVLPDQLTEPERDVVMKELMDVTRTAMRLGAREVHMVCLESREEMPAFEEEIEEGRARRVEDSCLQGAQAVRWREQQTGGARDGPLHFRFRCPAPLQPGFCAGDGKRSRVRYGHPGHRPDLRPFVSRAPGRHRNDSPGNGQD